MKLLRAWSIKKYGKNWDYLVLEHLSYFYSDRNNVKRRYPAIGFHVDKRCFTCAKCGKYIPPEAWCLDEKGALIVLSVSINGVKDNTLDSNNVYPLCDDCTDLFLDRDELGTINEEPQASFYKPVEPHESCLSSFVCTYRANTEFDVQKLVKQSDRNLFLRDKVYKL